MSSSIEEQFQPPEWATKEEVIKAAQHYINYWKIEARQRNQQWLDALQGADNAKRCEDSLRGELNRKHKEFAILQSARERDVAEIHRLKAEVERLTAEVSYDSRVQLHVDKLAAEFTMVEVERLKAEVERLNALIESNLNSSKVAMGKADAVLHERDRLKAEVERLRKAGDYLADHLAHEFGTCPSIEIWNAAKEGNNLRKNEDISPPQSPQE